MLKIAIAGYIILIHTDVDHENKTRKHTNILFTCLKTFTNKVLWRQNDFSNIKYHKCEQYQTNWISWAVKVKSFYVVFNKEADRGYSPDSSLVGSVHLLLHSVSSMSMVCSSNKCLVCTWSSLAPLMVSI